jgi:NADPH:quinone reductase-like Zn-dependent oxidoreductase
MPLVMTIHQFGLGSLRAEHRVPDPLGEGTVRMAIKAVALNYRDILVMRGTYGPGLTLPLIPCSDAAGIIVEVGTGVTDLHVGDRVCTHMVPDWHAGRLEPHMRLTTLGGPADGVLCEERVLPRQAVLPIPPALAFEEAACLPVAGLTAWSALTTTQIGSGSRVLLLGTGGVSMMGLDIAKKLGAKVAMISSADEKLARVQALGADFTANYRREPWGEKVWQWSERGVDKVLEVGGDGTFDQSVRATRDGGYIALLGVLAHRACPINLTEVLMRQICVQGIFVGSRATFERYLAFVETHGIRPTIDRVFELSAARQAFAYLLTGRHLGKVVVRIAA